MQRKVDHALGRVSERHQPFVGAASRQQPVRRTVRVRLPLRLPRPMSSEDIAAILASFTTLRDLAIFLLMLDGGLRPGEVLCLQLGDISYGRRRVTILNWHSEDLLVGFQIYWSRRVSQRSPSGLFCISVRSPRVFARSSS